MFLGSRSAASIRGSDSGKATELRRLWPECPDHSPGQCKRKAASQVPCEPALLLLPCNYPEIGMWISFFSHDDSSFGNLKPPLLSSVMKIFVALGLCSECKLFLNQLSLLLGWHVGLRSKGRKIWRYEEGTTPQFTFSSSYLENTISHSKALFPAWNPP